MQPQSMLKKFYVYIEILNPHTRKADVSYCCLFFISRSIGLLLYAFIEFGRFFGTGMILTLYSLPRGWIRTIIPMISIPGWLNWQTIRIIQRTLIIIRLDYGFFGSIVSKITGLTVFTGNFIVVLLFLLQLSELFISISVIPASKKNRKNYATIILISMPNVAMILLNYRPQYLFYLLIMIHILHSRKQINWKHLPGFIDLTFIIISAIPGQFIFLIGFVHPFLLYIFSLGAINGEN